MFKDALDWDAFLNFEYFLVDFELYGSMLKLKSNDNSKLSSRFPSILKIGPTAWQEMLTGEFLAPL